MLRNAFLGLLAVLSLSVGANCAKAEPFDFVPLRIGFASEEFIVREFGQEFLHEAKRLAYRKLVSINPKVLELTPKEFQDLFFFDFVLEQGSGRIQRPTAPEFVYATVDGRLQFYIKGKQLARSLTTGFVSKIDPDKIVMSRNDKLNFVPGHHPYPLQDDDAESASYFLRLLSSGFDTDQLFRESPQLSHIAPNIGVPDDQITEVPNLRARLQNTPARFAERKEGIKRLVFALIENMDLSWYTPPSVFDGIVANAIVARPLPGFDLRFRHNFDNPKLAVSSEERTALYTVQRLIERHLNYLCELKLPQWNGIVVELNVRAGEPTVKTFHEETSRFWGLIRDIGPVQRRVAFEISAEAKIAGRTISTPGNQHLVFIIDEIRANPSYIDPKLSTFFSNLEKALADTGLNIAVERSYHRYLIASGIQEPPMETGCEENF